MKKLISIWAMVFILFCGRGMNCFAQNVGINNTGNAPNSSAMLDVDASPNNNKGLLIPRLTTAQQNAIVSPAIGLIIYNTDCNTINYYNGASWIAMGNTGSISTPGSITGNIVACQNSTGIAYSIASVAGATGYNWSMPSGSVVASGQGSASITVNFGTISGNICVTAGNACGTSNASCIAITVTSGAPVAPTAGTNTPSATQVVWNWNTVAGAAGYKYNTTNNYGTATDNLTSTSYTQTGLTCSTPYTLYVWAYNSCGNSTVATLTQTTSAGTIGAPSAGTNTPSPTQIVWNWNTVAGATGYKYNTTNNYGTATDNLTATSYTQTGLTCNTAYSLYVWAYTGCANSASPVTLSQTTSACPASTCYNNSTCTGGSTFTDSRDAQVYNQVQISSQCWMAQNLNYGTQVTGGTAQTVGVSKYCQSDNAGNCTTYGALYYWTTLMNGGASQTGTGEGPQGMCPSGWHVPSDLEWQCMEMNLGLTLSQATTNGAFEGTFAPTLKSSNSSFWLGESGNTNSSGWTAIGSGNYSGGYANLNQTFYVASSTLNGSSVFGRSLWSGNGSGMYRESTESQTTFGWAVRCVKN